MRTLRLSTPARLGLRVALLVGTALCVAVALGAIHPADLLLAGRANPAFPLVRHDFPQMRTDVRYGYDGQQFYAIARTFPHLARTARFVDVPRYRLLRVLQPALASLARTPTGIVLAFLVLGAIGLGLAVGAVADLCERHGHDHRLGLIAAVPLLFPVLVCTVEPLAFGLAFLGLALADRRRFGPAVVALALAGLTRETALVVGVAAAVGLVVAERRPRALVLAVLPPVPLVAWHVWLGHVVGGTLPRRTAWLDVAHVGPSAAVPALAVLALGVVGAWCWRHVPAVWPVALSFGLWVLVYQQDSLPWHAVFRLSAPAVAFGLAGLVHSVRSSSHAPTKNLWPEHTSVA